LFFNTDGIYGLNCLTRCWENEFMFCAPRTSSSSKGNFTIWKSS
jgi:hypothetical protein